jgi:type II secretory pathway pseudopilin PulG
MSLVEMIVTVMLLGVVGTLVLTGLTSGMRTTSTVQDQGRTAGQLRIAVERIARELRAADPVELGTARSDRIQVRIVRNGTCTRFVYRPLAGNLVQYTQRPLTPAPAAPGAFTIPNACVSPVAVEPPTFLASATPRILATGISTTAVFTYWDAADNALAFPAPAGATYTEKDIARIRVTLTRPASGRAKSVSVSTEVTVHNAVANQREVL